MTSSNEPIRTILTKTYDGGSSNYGSRDNHFDAFSHYSNWETRMRALLGRHDDSLPRPTPIPMNEEAGCQIIAPSSKRVRADIPVHRRETRISFELHPSLAVIGLVPMNDECVDDLVKQ
jgi:hypothetical protein